MKHVVSYSGGAGSYATAKRVAEQHGTDGLVLLVADTNTEADDWRPFIDATAADIGGELVILDNDGRDIWDVFRAGRFIGNSRVDLCSRVLKREPLRSWLDDNCDPVDTVIYLGFDWTETHRLDRARPHWEPWTIAAPLTEPPYRTKADILDELRAAGLPVPALYEAGFGHNNCGGACVKAGQAEWRRLLYHDRARYLHHEEQEQGMRELLDADVAILRDRTGGTTTPVTLRAFRQRLETEPSLFDPEDFGSCACMEPAL